MGASCCRWRCLIAIVVMVQTAATTRSFPSDPDKPADVDRDFLGAGAGSLLAGLFGAFPVNASPPRTGIVSETGGRTQMSGLFAAAIVLALLAFGAALLRHVPNAALGGVLLFVALRIIRLRQIVAIYRQSLGEFLLIVATAAAIIVLPIEQGVAVGIALSLLHGIWSTTRARLVQFDHVPDTTIWWPANPNMPGERNPGVAVVGLQAPLSFLNAENFRADMLGVVWKLRRQAAAAGAGGQRHPRDRLHRRADPARPDPANAAEGVTLAMARLESTRAQEAFERFGIYDVLPKDHIFFSVDEAVRKLGKNTAP